MIITVEAWDAVRAHCQSISEVSASNSLRRLLRDRTIRDSRRLGEVFQPDRPGSILR